MKRISSSSSSMTRMIPFRMWLLPTICISILLWIQCTDSTGAWLMPTSRSPHPHPLLVANDRVVRPHHPFPVPHHHGIQRSRIRSSRTCTRTRLASLQQQQQQQQQEETVKHMFQSSLYQDKPIVLIGASSTSTSTTDKSDGDGDGSRDELHRLANHWVSLFDKKETTGTVWNYWDHHQVLYDKIGSSSLTPRDVIVLDYTTCPSACQTDGEFQEVAKTLYDTHGLLSIYVNVQTSCDAATTTTTLTSNHEDDGPTSLLEAEVFLPYSDYELCIETTTSQTQNGWSDTDTDTDTDADPHAAAAAQDAGVLEWEHTCWELQRLVARALLPPAIPGSSTDSDESSSSSFNSAHLTMGPQTFFVSCTLPEYNISQSLALPDGTRDFMEDVCRDVDAVEFRADLLTRRENRFQILVQQQWLRRRCRPHAIRAPFLPLLDTAGLEDVMPLVFTVRSDSQAGTFPTSQQQPLLWDLLELGLRSGANVLDVECAWDKDQTDRLLSLSEARYASQILGSQHVVGNVEPTSLFEAVELFEACSFQGRAHGTKVVLSMPKNQGGDNNSNSNSNSNSNNNDSVYLANQAGEMAASVARSQGRPVLPYIGLVLGEEGILSRVANERFTPVTHDAMGKIGAPGQMTASELITIRLLTGTTLRPKAFCILGRDISKYTASPNMFGAAFAATQLSHEFYLADFTSLPDFLESDLWQGDNFGGCSVTIPYKQAIVPHVDVLSKAAQAIGSVNTIVMQDTIGDTEIIRQVHGHNTDWMGIYRPVARHLGRRLYDTTTAKNVLLLGAGGTARAAAYAAQQLWGSNHTNLFVWNRTPEKAVELANAFGGTVVTDLSEDAMTRLLDQQMDPNDNYFSVILATVPAAANLELPTAAFRNRPVVLDVNYKPWDTQLLIQAQAAGCSIVRGSEMLWEQGVGQFELWTQRTAPYKVMKEAVLDACLNNIHQDDDSSELPIVDAEIEQESSWDEVADASLPPPPPKRYAILGHNIAYSVSPQMQNAAFEANGLPHTYGRADVETVDEFISGELWNAPDFGGCSVTIPHKQAIMPHLDELTEAAQTIGSVNTIIVSQKKASSNDDDDDEDERVLVGDNTDWKGIYNPVKRKLSTDASSSEGGYALILGAGGTARAAAYAAKRLGLTPIYYNRTPDKAVVLAASFGGSIVTEIAPDGQEDDIDEKEEETPLILNRAWFKDKDKNNIHVVLSTLPAAVGFTLPNWMLEEKDKLIVLDVNYKPYHTPLLTQATEKGCQVVRGSEMLWEQGVGQFELWTQQKAPYDVMKEAVLASCLPEME
eukprot:scaffold158592_cov54-Attheya_sp.AAC.2